MPSCSPFVGILLVMLLAPAVAAQTLPPGSTTTQGQVIDELASRPPPPGGPPEILSQGGNGNAPGAADATGAGTPPAARSGRLDLRQVHRAFDEAVAGPGQALPGLVRYRALVGQTMSVNIAVGLTTAVVLPRCQRIRRFFTGDEVNFPVRQSREQGNLFFIDAIEAGIDAAVQVEMDDGGLHAFYVRSIPSNSEVMSDLTVLVEDPACPAGRRLRSDGNGTDPAYTGKQDLAVERRGAVAEANRGGVPAEDPREFSRSVPFDPAAMHVNDIEVLATDKSDMEIAPVSAWHDEIWTYFDYRSVIDRGRVPVPLLVEDGVDQKVNWRVIGNGILVVEAVAPTMILKSGQSVLCVRNRWRPFQARQGVIAGPSGGGPGKD